MRKELLMRFFLFGFVVLLLVACKKDNEAALNDYDYYPLEEGNWYIYDVSVKRYNGSPIASDSSYQMKEEIVAPITVDDETRYQLYRYYRKDDTQAWDDQPDSVWTVFLRGNQLVKVENNERKVKLSFPLEPGKTWNGNSMNALEEEQYEMKNVRRLYTIEEGDTYGPTVTVLHADALDKTRKDYRFEVYAKGVGLIYKLSEVYKYDQLSLGTYTIDVGTYVEHRLSSYGKN